MEVHAKKDNRFSYVKLLLIMLSVTLGACATPDPSTLYVSPSLDENEIAIIESTSKFHKGWGVMLAIIVPFPKELKHSILITEIDGLKTHYIFIPPEIRLKAGQHTVKLSYKRERVFGVCGHTGCGGFEFYKHGIEINFLAESEHKYRVFAYIPDEQEWVWVKDMTTGKIVAGEKPKDLNTYY